MDLESLNNLRDKRNRFQVNRVDSVATGHHSSASQTSTELPESIISNGNGTATLLSYKEISNGNGVSPKNLTNGDGIHENGDKYIYTNGQSPPNRKISENEDEEGHGHNNTHTVSGAYAKSFRHFTREALPRLDNYRNMMSIQASCRPTLDELHNITVHGKSSSLGPSGKVPERQTLKFGWIRGVLLRCILSIFGVILFLRVSWMTGQAGIGQSLLIILSSSIITFITALSCSSICTNGIVKGGGAYYMISRSLGPEFGASIGLIFAVANAVAVAMYTVGFAESVVDLLDSFQTNILEDPRSSIRLIGALTICVLLSIVVFGMEWEATAQIGLLIVLILAMIDFLIGSFVGPLSDEEYSKGFVGFNTTVFWDNLGADYRPTKEGDQNFFSVFSIFFPAATGILAGANISGDLKDPQVAIPKGTLLAILITTISYMAFSIIAGAVVVRDATGNSTVPLWAMNNSREYIAASFRDCDTYGYNILENGENSCKWGLMNSFQVMELVSVWGPLIYAGCFSATLSSALASLVSAPKVFQALCNDKVFPYLEFFGKGYGKNNEPIRAYVLTFLVALAFILIGELNYIAPLISNFFLAAYALVNFSTFHASLVRPVGWRPTFKYYNMWLSLLGFILCVAVMFLISWTTALLTFAAILFLYLIVIYRKPEVNWGSSTQAQRYTNALTAVQQLNNIDDHVKNFRPQILVLSGLPSIRPPLVDFAHLITKNLSLLMCGHILTSNINNRQRAALTHAAQNWLRVNRIKGFFCAVDEMNFEEGARSLLQSCGVGKLSPNILLMGYKQNWQLCNREELLHYFNTIHKSLDLHTSVTVLRIGQGLDFSKKVVFGNNGEDSEVWNLISEISKSKGSSDESLPRNPSLSQMSQASSGEIPSSGDSKGIGSGVKLERKENKAGLNKDPITFYKNMDGTLVSKETIDRLTLFQKKVKGTIDVWWLYDDGGLTLLLPYIINTRTNWSACKLRVFALANRKDELDDEQRRMAEMLAKFRIDYSDLIMIPDYNKKPQESTLTCFESMIAPFKSEGNGMKPGTYITETELLTLKDKSNRHLRLHELLQEYSSQSDLVVMTLPMPKKGIVSAPLYMAWLELLTKEMPPFLLVRGNQQSVLTFYS